MWFLYVLMLFNVFFLVFLYIHIEGEKYELI